MQAGCLRSQEDSESRKARKPDNHKDARKAGEKRARGNIKPISLRLSAISVPLR